MILPSVLSKLSKIILLLGAAGVAYAQSQTSQSDAFHIVNCAKPCVAELALTQMPTTAPTITINGVSVSAGMAPIKTTTGMVIVVSFPATIQIQNTDLIVATYPFTTTSP